jgi:AcrR family transcriptional regulator
MKAVKRRRYHAPQRLQQAESTRSIIVDSGRRLFAKHGYSATTLDRIAREAGVAVQTVYAIFGSKRAILMAMLDAMDAAVDVPALVAQIRATADPREQLRLAVGVSARVFSAGYDVVDIVRGAGTADPDLASVWRDGEARRRPGQAELVRQWATTGVLRRGLSTREATDILWAMTGPDVYRLFVVENRWSLHRYQRWLTNLLEGMLLG